MLLTYTEFYEFIADFSEFSWILNFFYKFHKLCMNFIRILRISQTHRKLYRSRFHEFVANLTNFLQISRVFLQISRIRCKFYEFIVKSLHISWLMVTPWIYITIYIVFKQLRNIIIEIKKRIQSKDMCIKHSDNWTWTHILQIQLMHTYYIYQAQWLTKKNYCKVNSRCMHDCIEFLLK